MDILGIDVAKEDFQVCLLSGSRRSAQGFKNTPAGFRKLLRWVGKRSSAEIHACMEATGCYWLDLAQALFEGGLQVSVANPSRIAFFARSQLLRTKTDRVDAAMIADFCRTQGPSLWSPPSRQTLELRGLLSYRHELINEQVRLKQIARAVHVRDELKTLHRTHLQHIKSAIDALDAQIRSFVEAEPLLAARVAKLESVKGIGPLTAAILVAKLPVDRLRDAKAAAAYVGLSPREFQSGTSVHRKVRICKTGDATLRRDLYMPANSAMRHNPILGPFAARLRARGKPPKVVTVAVMRKLVVLAYQLLKEPNVKSAVAA